MFQIQTNWSYPTSYTEKLRCIFALCFLWNIEERNRSFANTLHGTCAQGRCIFNSLVLRIPTFYHDFECWCGSELRVWKFLNNIYFCFSVEVYYSTISCYVRLLKIPESFMWETFQKKLVDHQIINQHVLKSFTDDILWKGWLMSSVFYLLVNFWESDLKCKQIRNTFYHQWQNKQK